ncbi:hypothetical protein ACKKBG_A08165 [Auxenochlorella protothecoides x Auxenochlorella symbiontica]
MDPFAELLEDVERAVIAQETCSKQAMEIVGKCLEEVQHARAILGGGSPDGEVVGATAKALSLLKVDAKLASGTKNLHKAVGTLGKTIDKTFTSDISKAWGGQPSDTNLLNQAILEHLHHEGQFEVASTLAAETGLSHAHALRQPYEAMHAVLQQIHSKNLDAALAWVETNRSRLEETSGTLGSFEFHVRKVAFLQILSSEGRLAALQYARQHLQGFQQTELTSIQQLMGALCFAHSPTTQSPYTNLLGDEVWDSLAADFVSQSCALLGQAQDSPLLVTVAAGAASLPTILKLANVMPMQQGLADDGSGPHLPVDIPLGREFTFNSIFACPVSREQSTPENPPVILPCGHCMCKQSILKIAKSMTRSFKCPYCPAETTPLLCKEIVFPPVC